MADQSSTNTRPARDREYPPGYGIVEPVANYRPWDVDLEFQSVYDQVREHTMVDIYRLWVLWTISRQLSVQGDVLEVGSWRGGSGALLARSSAPRSVILADTFAGIVKAGSRDTYYKGGEHSNTSVAMVEELLRDTGVSNAELLAGVFPDETGPRIHKHHFALCHIDVDVYQSARDTFDWVWPRMADGGVVVFDDYGFYGCEGVTECVREIMESDGPVVIPNLSGQAAIVKTGH
jgi:O-methyltransferase